MPYCLVISDHYFIINGFSVMFLVLLLTTEIDLAAFVV